MAHRFEDPGRNPLCCNATALQHSFAFVSYTLHITLCCHGVCVCVSVHCKVCLWFLCSVLKSGFDRSKNTVSVLFHKIFLRRLDNCVCAINYVWDVCSAWVQPAALQTQIKKHKQGEIKYRIERDCDTNRITCTQYDPKNEPSETDRETNTECG